MGGYTTWQAAVVVLYRGGLCILFDIWHIRKVIIYLHNFLELRKNAIRDIIINTQQNNESGWNGSVGHLLWLAAYTTWLSKGWYEMSISLLFRSHTCHVTPNIRQGLSETNCHFASISQVHADGPGQLTNKYNVVENRVMQWVILYSVSPLTFLS